MSSPHLLPQEKTGFQTKPEMLALAQAKSSLRIGIPKIELL